MASIVETIAGDKRLKLGNEQFVRKLAVGSNWKVIAICLRLSFDCNATAVGNPLFAVGVCSGTTNCVGDATTTNFYGMVSNSASNATINYASSPGCNSHTFSLLARKKVGTTWTTIGSGFTGIITSIPATHHCVLKVLIHKENLYGHVGVLTCRLDNAGSGTRDITLNDFLLWMAGMELNNYPYQISSGTIDETPGALDTVNIMWNNDVYKMEISDIGVYKWG